MSGPAGPANPKPPSARRRRPFKPRRHAGPAEMPFLRFSYEATFRLDPSGPTWSPAVLREVRLPRWGYAIHDRGTAVFARAEQRLEEGPTEARLRLTPGKPMPDVSLDIDINGRWSASDERMAPPPRFADILEEAEALLVLLGCRTPQFRLAQTVRSR